MSDQSSNLPVARASLDRAALERVLSRAAELQAAEGEQGYTLSEQQLLEIGKEVGIAPQHLRQAMAEERTRATVPQEGGRVASFFGPTRVAAARIVRGSPASALQGLDRWMETEELLRTKRRFPDGMSWEARRDFLGSVKRGFNVGGRGYALSAAYEVAAIATPEDSEQTFVQLTADYGNERRKAIWGAATMGSVLTVASGSVVLVAATLGGSLIVAGVAAALGLTLGGASVSAFAKANRTLIMRGQLALEQALDRLEHRPASQKSTIGSLLDAAVRELK